jgi:uncharacterized linocin/CFP29 family protein
MSESYLQRADAPFGAAVWEAIDAAVTGMARARLSARRILEIEGPYGLALRTLYRADGSACGGEPEEVRVRIPSSQPVPFIESSFCLDVRAVAAFESLGQPLDLAPAVRAAAAVAAREDDLLFAGNAAAGLTGLLNAKGVKQAPLRAWDDIGAAAENVLQAVDKLDEAGFHGPYALALPPARYNRLFRLYPQAGRSELEQLRLAVTGGIIKSASLKDAGVLVTSVRELAAIVIGQDLETAFVGPSGRAFELGVSESVALQLREPASVCVMK